MVEFLLASPNTPFLVAYIFMLAFGLVTAIGGMMDHAHHGHEHDLHADASHDVGHDLPADHDAELHGDLDHDGDIDLGDHVLGFLGLGKAPITMLLVSFAWSFGSMGYITQWIARQTGSGLLHMATASLIALIPALTLHHLIARGLSHFTAREDSTAIHSDTFIGKTATVVLGQTSKGKPTQAKLKDQHGQTHYVLVEPHRDEDVLAAGEEVVLVSRKGALFEVMPTDIDILTAELRAPAREREQV